MKIYAASPGRRGKPFSWFPASHSAALGTVRRHDAATREADARVSPRVSVSLVVLSSLALWALTWFALECLISNWP
jgi:hypothetical protein